MDKLRNLVKCLSSPDEETRRLAVIDLGEYGIGDTKGYLFQALGDESWRVRKEAVELISRFSLSPDLVEELISLLRSEDNAGLRNAAVEILVRLGQKAVPALRPYVDDADHDVRKFIIDIMGSIGDASFVPIMIRSLADPDPNVCAAAVENLGKLGDPRAVEPLLALLEKPDVWLQHTILEALGRIGRPVPARLVAALAEHGLLKKAVYECLGAVGDADSMPVLLSGLGEKAGSARQAAACAVEKVRERLPAAIQEEAVDRKLRALKGTPVVDRLIESLATSDAVARKAVIRILGIIADERAAGALLRGCGDDRFRSCCLQAFTAMGPVIAGHLKQEYSCADEEERCVITYLCGEMDLQYCTPLLEQGIHDSSPSIRREAAMACGKMGLVGLIPDIAPLLHDSDPEVREGAIVALSRLAEAGGEEVARIAEALSTGDDPEKRRDSAYLFGALQDAERLSLLMKDEDVSVRKTAVTGLADLGNRADTGHLLLALVDEDAEIRIVAASALGETGGKDAIDSLLLLLNDDDPRVQCAVLKSLGKVKGDKALQAAKKMLGCGRGLVLIAAIEALGAIGGDKAIDLLEGALKNEDEEVVKTAMDQLARTGDNWLARYRDDLIHHPHWGVRSRFAKLMVDLLGERAVPYLREMLNTESDDLVRDQIRQIMERYQ